MLLHKLNFPLPKLKLFFSYIFTIFSSFFKSNFGILRDILAGNIKLVCYPTRFCQFTPVFCKSPPQRWSGAATSVQRQVLCFWTS